MVALYWRVALFTRRWRGRGKASAEALVKQVASAAFQLPAKALQCVDRDILEALLNSVDRRLIDVNFPGERGLGHHTLAPVIPGLVSVIQRRRLPLHARLPMA